MHWFGKHIDAIMASIKFHEWLNVDTTSRLIMLLEVIEQGSFTKAAELRNIDRSVFSKQITKLEEELGTRLLNRTTRSFSLTAAGAEMVKKAKELRYLLNDTVKLASSYHLEPKGLLRITSSSFIGNHYLMPVINTFQKRYPQVQIELSLDDRLVDIIADGFDLAFRVGELKDSSLVARKLAQNKGIIIATPKFVEAFGAPKTVEELSDLPAVTYHSKHITVDTFSYIDLAGNRQEQIINSVFRSNDADALVTKVQSHTAYMVVPTFFFSDRMNPDEFVRLLPDIELENFNEIYALYPHRDLPVRTRLFLDAARHYIGDDEPRWERRIPI